MAITNRSIEVSVTPNLAQDELDSLVDHVEASIQAAVLRGVKAALDKLGVATQP